MIADHAELTTSLAEKVMVLEAEVDRLKSELDAERSGNATVTDRATEEPPA